MDPPFWFILGGSLSEDLELFHIFKTSPRSSKSESGCESYACFSFGVPGIILVGRPVTSGNPVRQSRIKQTEIQKISHVRQTCFANIRIHSFDGVLQPSDVRCLFCHRTSGNPPDVRHFPEQNSAPTAIWGHTINTPSLLHGGVEQHNYLDPHLKKSSLSFLLPQILDTGEICESS